MAMIDLASASVSSYAGYVTGETSNNWSMTLIVLFPMLPYFSDSVHTCSLIVNANDDCVISPRMIDLTTLIWVGFS